MAAMKLALLALSLCLALSQVHGFYLPGMAPRDYEKGDAVKLSVNVVSAPFVLPYDYYNPRFHFCAPKDGPVSNSESLGSILFGDRLQSSPFELQMLVDKTCSVLCEATVPADDAHFINERIHENYILSWLVDGLPAAQIRHDADGQNIFKIGFQLGTVKADTPFLHNHYDITLHYHSENEGSNRIVGVLVDPYSVKNVNKDSQCQYGASHTPDMSLSTDSSTTVTYTYNVRWIKKTVSWATRWDNYLHVTDAQVHWFSIINSIVIVFMLSGMVAMILLRALHKDISRYNSFADEDGGNEDFGWKLVHADVFRPPQYRMILSVLIGNGAQMFLMCGVTLVFAVLGFLSPSSRGSLATVTIMFYILFAGVAGYVSARLYHSLFGEHWRRNVMLTATLIPGTLFLIFIILNFFLIGADSSSAVPFGTMAALFALWFFLSLPLCMVGAYYGFQAPVFESPCKTNQIPRQIPTQPLYLSFWVSVIVGGILPFGAIFIELFFIMGSIWFHRIYYVFGFLFLVFIILIITCTEVSVLMCYFHLCNEDYNWSWRAFMTSGASGLYMFLYSILYYVRQFHFTNVPAATLYFGWSLVMSILFAILTGTVGYVACFAFVRKIFGAIKVD